jgi:hypothetical protein
LPGAHITSAAQQIGVGALLATILLLRNDKLEDPCGLFCSNWLRSLLPTPSRINGLQKKTPSANNLGFGPGILG